MQNYLHTTITMANKNAVAVSSLVVDIGAPEEIEIDGNWNLES